MVLVSVHTSQVPEGSVRKDLNFITKTDSTSFSVPHTGRNGSGMRGRSGSYETIFSKRFHD
jgi:hypothetical protein